MASATRIAVTTPIVQLGRIVMMMASATRIAMATIQIVTRVVLSVPLVSSVPSNFVDSACAVVALLKTESDHGL
jgi:hypothetical protein